MTLSLLFRQINDNTITLPNVTINNFTCLTDKFVTEILALLKPHAETKPELNPSFLLHYMFDTYYRLQCIIKTHHRDIQHSTQATSIITAFIQKRAIYEIPTPKQVVDFQPVST